MKISPTTDKQIPNKDGGVLLYGWDTLRKEQGAHKCWGAMKKKSDVGPISFIAEEKNNILLLNTIPAEFVATIQLAFPVGCFPSLRNRTFLWSLCLWYGCGLSRVASAAGLKLHQRTSEA